MPVITQPPSQDRGHDTASPKENTHSDPSGAIFSMYITRVQKFEDEKNVENWKGGADGILVFTGLFSSTVATFIALSYPNLQQDPNVTTQFLLTQISQQLANANTNGTVQVASPSIASSFSPPTSVVFINAVWFLSLVLSLTCALMATLLQQWARRYLQIVQGKYAPLHHARIHEYFSRGARRFGISEFVEALPLLLLISVFLFFAGLVVFAFRGNQFVAYFTLASVGFCTLSYIALTLMPLIFHDCPYQTPLTPVLWFSAQIISHSFFSFLYHGTKQLYNRWGIGNESAVKSFHRLQKNNGRSPSENIISKLESSTAHVSIDTNIKILTRTLHWLNEDPELDEFVAGIPGLYESVAFTHNDGEDIRPVLAALPGPTNFHAPLPWSIIWLAQRSSTIQQKRSCLRALYHIPGAIHDILASYAAGKHYCLEILPLLNSPESLDIIDELWYTPNDDAALSVRCAAAAVAAFMVTPPRLVLDCFLTPDVRFIGDDDTGQQFLANRLRVGADVYSGGALPYQPRGDSVRLWDIVCFLRDIKDTLQYMNTQWWTDNAESIRRERRALFDARHTEEYRTGGGAFDQHGNRTSSAFIPAVQQDLITLTLEILARDPVANAGTSQRSAFRDACMQLGHVATTQARTEARRPARRQTQAHTHVSLDMTPEVLEALARGQVQAIDNIEMVRRPLEPVLFSLSLPQTAEISTPQLDVTSRPQMLVPSLAPVEMVSPNDTLGPAGAGTANRRQYPPILAPPLISRYSMSSSAGLAAAVADLGNSPVWGAQAPVAE